MTSPTLTIDFGTTRTSVAYFDESRGEPCLVQLGRNHTSHIPSIFYVPKEGQGDILVGDEAQDMAKPDPEGIVSGSSLKNDIHKEGKILRGSGRRSIERKQLVSELFRHIRQHCQEKLTDGKKITTCCLTVPPSFAQPQHEAIRRAAELGGFTTITILEEPVAASQAWLVERAKEIADYILVCICDTVGTTIGFSLVRYLDDQFRTDDKVQPLTLNSENINCASDYLNHAAGRVQRFSEDCAKAGVGRPAILLVGNGTHLSGLKANIEALKIGPVHVANNPEFAIVLGAATPVHLATLRKRIKADIVEIEKAEKQYFDLDQVLQCLARERTTDWKQAVQFGWPEAQWIVGACYLEKIIGWEHNEVTGAKYFQEAAKAGFSKALASLADCYENGKGVAYDPGKAVKLWEAAANAGEPDAQSRLPALYLFGMEGVPVDPTKAFRLLQKDSEHVSAWTSFLLGMCYLEGKGCQRNESEAQRQFKISISALRDAASKGGKAAQFFLGLSYLRGFGIKANPQSAVEWFIKSSEQDYAAAQTQLANCYVDGIGVPPDPKRAVELLKLAAGHNNASAQAQLGIYLLSGFGGTLDPSAALDWFRKSAERGDSVGQRQLGQYLLYGTAGYEAKPAEGFPWLKRAANQGDAVAESDMGYCLLYGIGVQRAPESAISWFQKSATQNCPVGISNLAYCYRTGVGVKQDQQAALALYRKAAEMGHLDSMMWLGDGLCDQNAGPASKVEAVSWFRRAAEQGHLGSLFELGLCYIHGTGVLRDETTGFSHIEHAADAGFPQAQAFLGNCWLNGHHFPANHGEAVKWFRKAAEQGDYEGQIGIGKCYLNGWGIVRDVPMAAKWLQPAADAEYPEAMTNLGKCYATGLI